MLRSARHRLFVFEESEHGAHLFQSGSLRVTAGAAFGGKQFALMHLEGLVLEGLPFVDAGAAEGDAGGFSLSAGLASGVEIYDVGHGLLGCVPIITYFRAKTPSSDFLF